MIAAQAVAAQSASVPVAWLVAFLAIGLAVASIQVDLMNKLVADHPGLEADIEASIAKYGRYL